MMSAYESGGLLMERHQLCDAVSMVGNHRFISRFDDDSEDECLAPLGKAKECYSSASPLSIESRMADIELSSSSLSSSCSSSLSSSSTPLTYISPSSAATTHQRRERRAARRARKDRKRLALASAGLPLRSLYGSSPSSSPRRFPKMLLVLDLDGTLVHSEFQRRSYQQCDFSLFNEEIFVYKRPYLDYFMATILEWFDVAVWTASGCEYAAEIVRHVFPDPSQVSFLFSSERCTNKYCPNTGERTVIKDMKKVKRRGHDLSQVLIVDDTPSTWQRNYGNAIHIEPYWGGRVDDHLLHLLTYLEYLGHQADVRPIDKRRWRSQVLSSMQAGEDVSSSGEDEEEDYEEEEEEEDDDDEVSTDGEDDVLD